MSFLSFITLEMAVIIGIVFLISLWLLGKTWHLIHNKYFWLVFLTCLGAFAFAMYDIGHRQTFFKWLGISQSWLGWAYGGGKTAWQQHGETIILHWNQFIGFFVTHPAIGYTVLMSIGVIAGCSLGLILLARVGAGGLRLARNKSFYWGLKTTFASVIAVLIIEMNLMIIDPNITSAIKAVTISTISSATYGPAIKNLIKGGISSLLYRDE